MLGGQLQAVDHAQDFIEIAAGRSGIFELELDLLVRSHDEHRAHGERVVGVGVDHVVLAGDGAVIGDQREIERGALGFLDVPGPAGVILELVDRKSQDLDAALFEFGLELGGVTELGRADRGVVLGVRKEHCPLAVDIIVEADFAFCGLGGKVGGDISDENGHLCSSPCSRARLI